MKGEEEFEEICEKYLENGKKIKGYEGNVLVIHAEDDHLVPVNKGKELFEAAVSSSKKELVIAPMGRHNISSWSPLLYWSSLFSFLDRVFPDNNNNKNNNIINNNNDEDEDDNNNNHNNGITRSISKIMIPLLIFLIAFVYSLFL